MLSPTHRLRSGLAVTLVAAAAITGLSVRAADHADAPDTDQGNLDINDIYAFNQGDDIVFVMTVSPLLTPGEMTNNAALNPRGLYELNLDVERDGIAEAVIQIASAGLGQNQILSVRGPVPPQATGTDRRIVPGPSLKGRFGEVLTDGSMTAWAGPSDDPFFIDLFGDRSLTSVLNAAFGAALGQTVGDPGEQSLAFADPAMDDLAGLNVLSIVVELPKSTISSALGIPADGAFYVWGTTSTR